MRSYPNDGGIIVTLCNQQINRIRPGFLRRPPGIDIARQNIVHIGISLLFVPACLAGEPRQYKSEECSTLLEFPVQPQQPIYSGQIFRELSASCHADSHLENEMVDIIERVDFSRVTPAIHTLNYVAE